MGRRFAEHVTLVSGIIRGGPGGWQAKQRHSDRYPWRERGEDNDPDYMKPMRVYIDTSVFGGCFDEEFQEASKEFFGAVREGKIVPLISDVLVAESVDAPEDVQDLLQEVIDAGCERLSLGVDVERLRDRYVSAGVVSEKFAGDALHVAHATLARADAIVSWNFRHLVNPAQIRAFNSVNLASGQTMVVIMAPPDIVRVLEESDESQEG